MGPVDRSVFHFVNRWPDSLEPVFVFMSEATKQWSVRLLLVALLAVLAIYRRTRAPALLAAVSWPIANGMTDLLKNGLQMARPCVELPDAIVRVPVLTSFGTASAHSANMAVVAFCFLRYYRPLGWAWGAVALLTGLSRIYVGVHYPSQVLLGWAVGALTSWWATNAYEGYKRSRSAEADPPAEPTP